MKKSRPKASGKVKVYLRYPAASDFDELVERYRGSRALFRGVASTRFDRKTFDEFIVSADTETKQSFVICKTEDDSIVGTVTLSQIFRKVFQNAYLGYQLFGGFTGKGYMTDAVDIVLHVAFNDLKLHRVEANVQPSNKPSIAVLKRNGFGKEGFSRRYLKIGGQWRDHERWAILKEDWSRLAK